MNDLTRAYIELLQRDRRFAPDAYEFIREALAYAQDVLEMGGKIDSGSGEAEQHLTGQELCEAVRRLALDQFGLMARTVLNNWGIHTTRDIGEIVYNLIELGVMRKSRHDRREDFYDVYDFEEAFDRSFEITLPES